MMTDAELLEIKDRLEIHELMNRYAEMIDRRDWKEMNHIFALEATIDFSSTGGHPRPFRETLAWLDRALESWPINLHFVTNLIVEIDGDHATARSYFHAPMARDTPDGTLYIITNAGRYEDRLVRTRNGWRITERICHQTLMEGTLPDGYRIPK